LLPTYCLAAIAKVANGAPAVSQAKPDRRLASTYSGKSPGFGQISPPAAGDALDLVGAALDVGMGGAMAWARRWLGIDDGAVRWTPIVRQPEPSSKV